MLGWDRLPLDVGICGHAGLRTILAGNETLRVDLGIGRILPLLDQGMGIPTAPALAGEMNLKGVGL